MTGLMPFISVIVPVRNEAHCIVALLRQLVAQNYDADRYEVLVADGGSTDATRALVAGLTVDYPQLRLVDNPRRFSSAGRNAAIRTARGDILVIVDGHCDVDNPDYLSDLAAVFADSGADCVGRPQPQEIGAATPLQQAIAAARASWLGHNPSSYIYSSEARFVPPLSVAVAYRRAVFETVGLFDETFDACEDVEFNHRVEGAGLCCFFSPLVAVHYHPRSGLRGLFRQLSRYGRGRVRLLRKFPRTFTIACFLPAFLMMALLAAPFLLLWRSPWAAAVYAIGATSYLGTVGLTSLALALRARTLRILPWLPLVFGSIHAGAGTGILREVVASFGQARSQHPVLQPSDAP
jgi:succinoglycan biosynthesis protein ExoA